MTEESEEDVSPLLVRYRSTVREEPTAALDEVILGAAARRVVRVRAMRRSAFVLAVATMAIILWPLWRAYAVRAPQARDARSYGLQEGATRYYLLNVARVRYTGPGSTEGRP